MDALNVRLVDHACPRHEWVSSDVWMSPVSHLHVMSHIWISHVTPWMGHVTHSDERRFMPHTCVMCDLTMWVVGTATQCNTFHNNTLQHTTQHTSKTLCRQAEKREIFKFEICKSVMWDMRVQSVCQIRRVFKAYTSMIYRTHTNESSQMSRIWLRHAIRMCHGTHMNESTSTLCILNSHVTLISHSTHIHE